MLHCKIGIDIIEVKSIQDTIDYSILLSCIQKHFAVRQDLLETLIQNIERDIVAQIPQIKFFFLSIKKLNPTLNALIESSEVILEKKY